LPDLPEPGPLTLKEVLGRVHFSHITASVLHKTIRPAVRFDVHDHTGAIDATVAAAFWLYQLLDDVIVDGPQRMRVVAEIYPVIAICEPWLVSDSSREINIKIYDRCYVRIADLALFNLQTGDRPRFIDAAVETLTYDVAELYRRNLAIILAARESSTPCPRPSD
jgi:hypothetical protein